MRMLLESAAAQLVRVFQQALLNSQVNALVSAMASFSPLLAGQTTLPADYQAVLNPVIAAAWI
jgi:hypothetical protein